MKKNKHQKINFHPDKLQAEPVARLVIKEIKKN